MKDVDKGRKREALTIGVQDRIVLLIQGWKPEWGDLNASALERKVTCCLGIACTRQGLLKKDAIRAAFDERMKLKDGKPPKDKPADVVVLQQRISRLESQLVERDGQLLEAQDLLVRFRHNARLMGIAAERLEAPLAPLVGADRKSV